MVRFRAPLQIFEIFFAIFKELCISLSAVIHSIVVFSLTVASMDVTVLLAVRNMISSPMESFVQGTERFSPKHTLM